jgi:hypothetical protein
MSALQPAPEQLAVGTDAADAPAVTDPETWSPIVELRQYTLHPGQRETLIELFDRELVEPQEAVGMKVIGQFRAVDDPDRFIWLRGFSDMPARARALEAFYGGPVWARHRDAANATMIDSDNVLLLRPAYADSGFRLGIDRPPPASTQLPSGLVVATIYRLRESAVADAPAFFESAVRPALIDSGASLLAVFVSEDSPNNYPRLPVREGEPVLAFFTAFAGEEAYERQATALSQSKPLLDELPSRVVGREVWRLRPTARSLCTAQTSD